MADLFYKASQNRLLLKKSQNLQNSGFLRKKKGFCDRKTQVFAKRLCVGFFSRKRVKWCLWLNLLKLFEFRFSEIYGELMFLFPKKNRDFFQSPKTCVISFRMRFEWCFSVEFHNSFEFWVYWRTDCFFSEKLNSFKVAKLGLLFLDCVSNSFLLNTPGKMQKLEPSGKVQFFFKKLPVKSLHLAIFI